MFLTKCFLVHISSILTFFPIFLCIFLFLYKIIAITLSDKMCIFIRIILLFPLLRKASLKFMQTYCIQCIYNPAKADIAMISACFPPLKSVIQKSLFQFLSLTKISFHPFSHLFLSGQYILFSCQETTKMLVRQKKESLHLQTLLLLSFYFLPNKG